MDIRSLAELFAKERAACVLNEQFRAEISQTKDAQRVRIKTDYLNAKILSHRANLQRYARLLATQLTELEREYLHKRIAEEHAEVARVELLREANAAKPKTEELIAPNPLPPRSSRPEHLGS